MLRVYVFHVLRLRFGSKVFKDARKYRHLEQGQDCPCNFIGHMDRKHCAPHSWYVPPTVSFYERMFFDRGDMADIIGIVRVNFQIDCFG
jgi:hypothetical protein